MLGTDALHGARYHGQDIDGQYVDGVSITYDSSPRKHIWTYAGGWSESGTSDYNCPCNTGYLITQYLHLLVITIIVSHRSTGYDDILWDGQQCNGLESPCCTAPNMPWFTTTLNDTTTSDIEVRACNYHNDGQVPFDILQLYIK